MKPYTLNQYRVPVALLYTAVYLYTNFEIGTRGVDRLRQILQSDSLVPFSAALLNFQGNGVLKMFAEPFSFLPLLVLLGAVSAICLFVTHLAFEAFFVLVGAADLFVGGLKSTNANVFSPRRLHSFLESRVVPLVIAYGLYTLIANWCVKVIALPVVFPFAVGV